MNCIKSPLANFNPVFRAAEAPAFGTEITVIFSEFCF